MIPMQWRGLFRRQPNVLLLIGLCSAVFIVQRIAPPYFTYSRAAVPLRLYMAFESARAGAWDPSVPSNFATLITSLFLHGDIEHLLGNMLFLWVFGSVVADILGRRWILPLFLLCGATAQTVQVALEPMSPVPIIGASGAISGLGGCYFGLVLGWRLPWPEVWPLARPVPPAQLAAAAAIGFVADLWSMQDTGVGIAYGAHVGGFMSGMLIGALLTARHRTWERFQSGRQR